MITLFVVFVFFAVAIPVALEERRHHGNNILTRIGKEILSGPIRALTIGLNKGWKAFSATVAISVGLLLFYALLGLLTMVVRFLLRWAG